MTVLCGVLVLGSCGASATLEEPTATSIATPDVVVQAMVDALIDGDWLATDGLVDERHMAFFTAIERGTASEVAAMLRSGVPSVVREDFWESFAESVPLFTGESIARIQVLGESDRFFLEGADFVVIDIHVADGTAHWILRLTEGGWVVDLLATFGTGLLPNLRGWFAFIGADENAAYVRDEFRAEVPSLRAGLEKLPLGPLSDVAQAAADELLADFGG